MLERISVNWERFVESRAREAYTAAMVELGVLAEKHIYLRLLYTRSFGCFSVNGYDQAEIQAIALDLKEFAKQFSETRKQVEKFFECVLDVDSAGREPQKQAAKNNRTIDVLLELHIAQEATKYGLTPDDCRKMLDEGLWREMKNVRIRGLMMMASNTDDETQIRNEFMTAANFFDEVKARHFADAPYFDQRSWGMSDDYPLAVECRSTMVRVGTRIFGPRVY